MEDDNNGKAIADFFKHVETDLNPLHDFDYNGGEDYSTEEGEGD